MKNIYFFYLFALISLFLCSCDKSGDFFNGTDFVVPQQLQPLANQITCFNNKITGVVAISSFGQASLNSQDNNAKGRIGGVFYNGPGQKFDRGDLMVGNFSYPQPSALYEYGIDEDHDATSLFGANVSVSLNSGATTLFNENIYVPQQIHLLFTSPTSDDHLFKISSQNKTIKWNEDQNNANGIAIVVYYSPTEFKNASLSAQGYDQYISNYVWLDQDLGKYELQASDFDNIPINGFVEVFISRAECTIASISTDDNVIIYGYSTVVCPAIYTGQL